jgi:hypothetical protein
LLMQSQYGEVSPVMSNEISVFACYILQHKNGSNCVIRELAHS